MLLDKLNKKNVIQTCWLLSTNIINLLYKILGVGIKKGSVVTGFDIVIEVNSKKIYSLILFLNRHTLCQFKTLIDIVCYDNPKKKNRFSLIYNLLSVHYNRRCRVITKLSELTTIFSIMGLYKAANWLEREVFDFFGIFFLGNKDLRRILTDYGFSGFPLRKDFPLSGYIDSYYDDNQKRICYRNLELCQEYRNFNLKNAWY